MRVHSILIPWPQHRLFRKPDFAADALCRVISDRRAKPFSARPDLEI
jgi:hypothetical protein